MRFLRDNLFLVCTLGAVIVAAVALPLANMALDREIQTREQARTNLARKIESAGKNPVNEQILRAKHNLLVERAESQAKAASLCTLWNGRNYQPFLLSFNSVKGPREIPALPIDTRTYEQYALSFKIADIYHKKLNELRAAMDPVQPVDAEEIKAEAEKIANTRARAQQFAPASEPAAKAVAPNAAAPQVAVPQVAAPQEDSPQDLAKKTLVKQRSMGNEKNHKMIYFEQAAMDVVVLPDTTRPTPVQIYQAMLNYWVTSDILAAIKATNDQAAAEAKGRGIKYPSVVDAAVKEIVKIDITEDYTTRMPESFTLRQTCRDYTILPYKFQVIMPLAALQTLQSKLLERNYHTILRVAAKSLPPMDAKTPPDKYYGTDPVMDITIEGELLLLADWERGNAADATLTATDILQWPAFTVSLVRQGLSTTPSAGKRIWALLSDGLKKNLANRVNATQDPAVRATLAGELKQILTRNDFYSAGEWKGISLTPQQQLMADKLDENRLTGNELAYFNRSLVSDAFAGMLAPPKYLPALVPVEVLAKMPLEALRQQDQDRVNNKTP
ncbi:MAG: hypothetical protein LLG01_08770 [Planctomycetaceae bacterium]|nr:hypothetical protein [Planctomycetaceae bacterium]